MAPYRDSTAIVQARADALHRQRVAELQVTPTGLRSVFVRRCARIAFGTVGALAAVFVGGVTASGATALIVTFAIPEELARTSWFTCARLLLLAWPLAVAAYLVAAWIAARVLRRRLAASVARVGDPWRDLAALAARGPLDVERALAIRNAHASHTWPLIAATLLAPHTLQLALSVLTGGSLDGFDTWMVMTVPASIQVFGYGLVVAWRFPRHRDPWVSLVIASAFGLLPLALFSAFAVLATGCGVLVVAYWPMRVIIEREGWAGLNPAYYRQKLPSATAVELPGGWNVLG